MLPLIKTIYSYGTPGNLVIIVNKGCSSLQFLAVDHCTLQSN